MTTQIVIIIPIKVYHCFSNEITITEAKYTLKLEKVDAIIKTKWT